MCSDFISGTDLPYCVAYSVCDNAGMYLKTHKRKKNGKVNEYYSIVEKRKVANGFYVQKTVLYGATSQASKSPVNWSMLEDFNNDRLIDFNDLLILCDFWLQNSECLPADIYRDGFVDMKDFAIFAAD